MQMMLDAEMLDRIYSLKHAAFDSINLIRDAFVPRKKMTVTEWSETAIYLSQRITAEAGRYDANRTPYIREPQDAFADPDVEEIDFMKSTQVAGTTFMLNCVGYAIDQDPGPALFIQPTEDLARETSDERVQPMLMDSPVLRVHVPKSGHDFTKMRYRLKRMDLHFAWSGSAAKLASKAKRYLFFDEVDKYPAFTGREANPIALAIERQRTFWNRKRIVCSTPTDEEGYINQRYLQSDRRTYRVPCPYCGQFQQFIFRNVRWPEGASADDVSGDLLAYYVCDFCEKTIHDYQKQEMLEKGVWCPDVCDVDIAGNLIGDIPKTRQRGYHISAIYSPWLTFSDVAAEFIKSKNNRGAMMNFVNSWLGEPWTERAREITEDRFIELTGGYKRGQIPNEVVVLTAGADVQKNGIYYTVRGWDNDFNSWLIDWDFIPKESDRTIGKHSLAVDIAAMTEVMRCKYPRKDKRPDMQIRLLAIDSRYRPKDVMKLARLFETRVMMIKGNPKKQMNPYKYHAAETTARGKPKKSGLKYAMIDTGYYKDMIANLYDAEPSRYHFPVDVTDEFRKQFLSEYKAISGHDTAGNPIEVWKKRPGHPQNHYWDDGVYEIFAADSIGVGSLEIDLDESQATSWFKNQRRR